MKKGLMLAGLLLQNLACVAMADCTKASPPSIPDGATVSEGDLKAAQVSVKSYVTSTNAYLACLDAEGQAAVQPEADADKLARTQKYNAAVDEMNATAAGFNAAVKAFKAAHK